MRDTRTITQTWATNAAPKLTAMCAALPNSIGLPPLPSDPTDREARQFVTALDRAERHTALHHSIPDIIRPLVKHALANGIAAHTLAVAARYDHTANTPAVLAEDEAARCADAVTAYLAVPDEDEAEYWADRWEELTDHHA